MTAIPVYAGVVVSNLEQALVWYERVLDCHLAERGIGWVMLRFDNGSVIELFEGDPAQPERTFPSYGSHRGPSVMPGYAIEDPEFTAANLPVARQLPDWVVVVAPDGLRIVLSSREGDGHAGIIGFRFSSPDPDVQQAFLDQIEIKDPVLEGTVGAVPLVAAERDGEVADPDGNRFLLVTA